jgi:hypothetical protein
MSGVTAPNANGLADTDPQFVDDTANLVAWAVSEGQSATVAAAIAYLRTDKATLIPAAVAWVRSYFRVTNQDLEDAGHDAATIGAMGFVAGTAPAGGVSMHGGMHVLSGGIA